MTTGATPFQHLFRRGSADGGPPLLLLHGSGMDEQAMTGFAAAVAPDTIWIAPRGQVPVGNGWAFFCRHPTARSTPRIWRCGRITSAASSRRR